MFARYLKSQLLVLLCGGLVGPIFLIVYFAIGPWARRYIAWMFWVGLLITAADVLIALALANFSAKSAANTAALEQNGVLALAQITGMGETGIRINDQTADERSTCISKGPASRRSTRRISVLATVTRHGNLQPAQTGGARRSGHERVPNRLGAKRSGEWPDAGAVHHRRGQQDLRPVRPGRAR